MSAILPLDSNQLYQALLTFNEGGQNSELSKRVDSLSNNVHRLDDRAVGSLYGRLTCLSSDEWEHFRATHQHAEGSCSVEQHGAFLSQLAKALVKAQALERIEKDPLLNQNVAAGEISRFVVKELLSQGQQLPAVRIARRMDDSRFQSEVCMPYLKSLQANRRSPAIIEMLHKLSDKRVFEEAIAYNLPRERANNPGFSNFLVRLLDPAVNNGANTAEMRADSVASWACQGGILDIDMMGQVARMLRAVRCDKQADTIDQHLFFIYKRLAIVVGVAAVVIIWGTVNTYMNQPTPFKN